MVVVTVTAMRRVAVCRQGSWTQRTWIATHGKMNYMARCEMCMGNMGGHGRDSYSTLVAFGDALGIER